MRGACPGQATDLSEHHPIESKERSPEVKELRNFVGGQWASPASGKQAELINPSTGEPFATTPVSDADDVDAAESENTGKPIGLTRSEEVPPMVDQIRFFAGAARMLEGRSAGEYMTGFTSFVRREPVGVCAAVTPWNYPMMMGVWKWAPALAAGNTMVLKPSDTTPVTSLLMAELMSEFLPPGAFNVVAGDRDTGRALVSR